MQTTMTETRTVGGGGNSEEAGRGHKPVMVNSC